MFESENESGSSSEEGQDAEKVENNARVPDDSTPEEESEESSQEEEIEEEIEEETEEVQQKKDVEQNNDVEKEIMKVNGVKKPMYKDIVLACFHHYPNEKLSLKKIKSYARTEHEITLSQENFLKLALKKLINDEIIQNHKGVGLTGSFKLVIKKPIKVKKIKEPSTLVSGKISIITAEVYGSTTKVAKSKEIPKPKADKKVNSKTKSSNKENTEEKVEPAKKKGKTGPKIEVVAKKPKEATVKIKAVTKQPKEATKREVPKKDLEQDTEEVPKKMRKPGPKKVVAPKEKQEVVTKKTAVAKKIPAKTTVGAIRKSIDNEKKKVAVPRPKRKG